MPLTPSPAETLSEEPPGRNQHTEDSLHGVSGCPILDTQVSTCLPLNNSPVQSQARLPSRMTLALFPVTEHRPGSNAPPP